MTSAEHSNGQNISVKSPREQRAYIHAEQIVDAFMPRAELFFQIASGYRDVPIPQTLHNDIRNRLIRAALRHKKSYGPLEDYLYRAVNQHLLYLQVEAVLFNPVEEVIEGFDESYDL